jgi:hypothetical protein
MFSLHLRLAFACAASLALSGGTAQAHCLAGARFFPATLNIEDPCVADELALPTVSSFRNGDDPSARQLDISGEYSKRITDTFALSVGSTWSRISPPGMPRVSGFQNLETAAKWQFLTDTQRELVMSVGFGIEWGRTGAQAIGAEPFNVYTPTFFFGKGFGDLPDSLRRLRPVAITGQVGYAIPGKSSTVVSIDPDTGEADIEHNPRVLVWGGSLQYSLPYLKSQVQDFGLPDFINRLIPIVEVSLQTPVQNTLTSGTQTTGTINPGVIWVGNKFQVAVEALIPINRQSGANVGMIAQLHFYLDDIDPRGIGRPIFGGPVQPASPFPR